MLASLLHASSRLLAPGLVLQQQHAGATQARTFSGRGRHGSAAAVLSAATDRIELSDGGGVAGSPSPAVWDAVACCTRGPDAASQRAVRCHASSSSDAAVLDGQPDTALAGTRQRSRAATAHGAKAAAKQGIGAPQHSRRTGKALPRRQQLKVPPVAAPDSAPVPASAADSAAPPATEAAATESAAADSHHASPAAQQQQQQPSAPTPLLQDFLSGQGRLVKSVYRQPGLHELQLQQEFSSEVPTLAPPLPPPQLPQHTSQAALAEAPKQQVSIAFLGVLAIAPLHCPGTTCGECGGSLGCLIPSKLLNNGVVSSYSRSGDESRQTKPRAERLPTANRWRETPQPAGHAELAWLQPAPQPGGMYRLYFLVKFLGSELLASSCCCGLTIWGFGQDLVTCWRL